MRISRKGDVPPTYYLSNSPLDPVTSYRYLGVYITNNLSWNTHIEHITAKANQTLGYLRRNFFLAPAALKLLLYTTYIRPQLEYASSVWDPGHSTLIDMLERVQNRASRFILGNYHRTSSVTQMKFHLGLPALATRRKNARLCLFHKIYYHNLALHAIWIRPPNYISSRQNHLQKVYVPHSNTVTHSTSFLPKTCNDWNRVPHSITSIVNPTLFKNALSNLLTS